jgi:hypothetical protein
VDGIMGYEEDLREREGERDCRYLYINAKFFEQNILYIYILMNNAVGISDCLVSSGRIMV